MLVRYFSETVIPLISHSIYDDVHNKRKLIKKINHNISKDQNFILIFTNLLFIFMIFTNLFILIYRYFLKLFFLFAFCALRSIHSHHIERNSSILVLINKHNFKS